MMQRGFKQREIAQKLGLTQQMVSYRWGVIKTTYPELLQKDEDLQITLPNSHKKTNDTKPTKVCTEEEFVENGEEAKVDDEPSWKKKFSF
jgi:predicted transcriptional regulator